MSLSIPTPETLAQRFAASLAQQPLTASDGSQVRLDATAPGTLEQVLASLHGLSHYEIYLFLRDSLLEMLPTTATAGTGGRLAEHARIWGVPRLGPQFAVGRVIIAATQALTIPQGALLTSDGATQWALDQQTTLSANAPTTASVTCVSAGPTGNLAGQTALTFVTPRPGVVSVVTDTDGCTGGSDIEPVEAWRERILTAIRQPYQGGSAQDYVHWAREAGAASVNVVSGYSGLGTVGVIVGMPGPTAPSASELAKISAYIDSKRPIRGNVTVYPVEIVPQRFRIALTPDTDNARNAVTAALSTLCLSVGIGETLYIEAIQSAIYGAAGAKNRLITPSTDITFTHAQLPVLAGIDWQGATS